MLALVLVTVAVFAGILVVVMVGYPPARGCVGFARTLRYIRRLPERVRPDHERTTP